MSYEEHVCRQLRELKETHITPLKEEWQTLYTFYSTRRPPEREKAYFYKRLLTDLEQLEKRIDKKLKVCKTT